MVVNRITTPRDQTPVVGARLPEHHHGAAGWSLQRDARSQEQADEGYSIFVLALQREAAKPAIRAYLDGTSGGSMLAFA